MRDLRKNHPDKWEVMLRLDRDSPKTFRPDGTTIHDLEARFASEDSQMTLEDFIKIGGEE